MDLCTKGLQRPFVHTMPPRMKKLRTSVALAATIALSVGTLTVLSQVRDGHGDARQIPLRVLATPEETMPRTLTRHIADIAGLTPQSLGAAVVQRIQMRQAGLWVVWLSSEDAICVAEKRHGAVGCVSVADFQARGIALGVFDAPERSTERPHRFRILGVAPDWVRTALLGVAERIRRVPVRRNSYMGVAHAPVTVVALIGEGRRWPPDSLPQRAEASY